MLESARARHALLESSFRLYQQLMADEQIDCEWEQRGCLFVYRTDSAMKSYASTDRTLSEFGLAAQRLEGGALCDLEPALRPGLAGGWYYGMDAHLRPDRLLAELRRVLHARNVEICEQRRVAGFVRSGGRVTAVTTDDGQLIGDHFLIATGSWTPLLNSWLGTSIPIQPGKGYSITMPHPAICPRIPLILQEAKVAVTPMRSAYRLGSTMEFAGYDTSLPRARLQALRDGAELYLRQPYAEPVQEEWFGWRPMTYDGKPIIDLCPRMDNVHIAAGHNMLGLSMGAATGKLVCELISGTPPHLDPQPYAIARFARNQSARLNRT
jgi:D-amino-acid dehydrogenase